MSDCVLFLAVVVNMALLFGMLSGRLSSGGLMFDWQEIYLKLILKSLYSAEDNGNCEERPDFSPETATTFIYNPDHSQSIKKQREGS